MRRLFGALVGALVAFGAFAQGLSTDIRIRPTTQLWFNSGISPAAQGNFIQASYALNKTSLDSVATFSRAGNAMQFDSLGYLTYGPNNLLTQSNTFSNAAWTKATMTVAAGFTDPFGGSNATRLTATGATSYVVQSTTGSSGFNALTSIWVRRVSGSGTINLWTIGGSTGTAITPTSTWTQYSATGNAPAGVAYAGIIIQTSGDVIEVYAPTASAVTYETTPRSQDQVITTSAAYYGPRFDYTYNGSSWVPAGLLVEGAATNLAIQSEALSGASWAVGGSTKSTDGTLYLNGATATKITAATTTNNHSISSALGVSVTSGQSYTQSVFVKAGTHTKVAVNVGAAANWAVAVFDISGTSGGAATQTGAGSDTSVSGVSYYLGGGWFRLALTFTASATGSRFLEFQMVPATTGNTFSSYGEVIWLAAGTETLYVGQPQLETGSVASSYTPTGASAVTRAAETAQLTGALAAVLPGSAGTLITEVGNVTVPTGVSYVVVGNAGAYASCINNAGGVTKNGVSGFRNVSNGFESASNFTNGGSANRFGVAWGPTTYSLSGNGAAVTTGSGATAFSGTPYLGSANSGATWINGHMRSFAVYNSRLPDATLQAKSVVGASYQ